MQHRCVPPKARRLQVAAGRASARRGAHHAPAEYTIQEGGRVLWMVPLGILGRLDWLSGLEFSDNDWQVNLVGVITRNC